MGNAVLLDGVAGGELLGDFGGDGDGARRADVEKGDELVFGPTSDRFLRANDGEDERAGTCISVMRCTIAFSAALICRRDQSASRRLRLPTQMTMAAKPSPDSNSS